MTLDEFFDDDERPPSETRSVGKRRSHRVAHAIIWPTLVLVLLAVGLAGWTLYSDAMSVRADLEQAQDAVADLQAAATAQPPALDQLEPIARRLDAAASRAVGPTAQPLWRFGEAAPVIGENLRAARVIAEGVDEISDEIVTPAVDVFGSFGLRRDEATGGMDLTPLREATEIVATADRVVAELHDRVAGIDTGSTIEQVAHAVGQLEAALGRAEQAIPQLSGALAAVGALLGVDGPKDVVLAFLNNAEAAPLGGGPAAQSLLQVDNGAVSVTRQVSSADLAGQAPLDIPIDESARLLYDDILLTEVNAATSRPDFPTAALLISARWQRDLGVTPDIVVSIDPLGLSRILEVTGPVTTAAGEELTSKNVVSKVLQEAYFRYPEGGPESDAYFAAASSAVFDRVMSADYDVWAMADAIVDAANRGSLMMWSADAATQALFDGTRLQGTMPADNAAATVLGVYFRDRSVSKIDYYLHSEATVTSDTCTPDAPTYTVEVRLRLDVPRDIELPEYVTSQIYDFFRTEVFIYGPVGATTTGVEVLETALSTTAGPSVVDLGRPAEKFTIDHENQQVAVVRATFAGAPGEYGPTEVRTTPMVNATKVTSTDASCG